MATEISKATAEAAIKAIYATSGGPEPADLFPPQGKSLAVIPNGTGMCTYFVTGVGNQSMGGVTKAACDLLSGEFQPGVSVRGVG